MIPRHMAIVMDGNGRWAIKRGLPRLKGHHEGLNALKKVITFALDQKILTLSVFAFSTENWGRPEEEVSYLMKLLVSGLKKEVKTLDKKNIKLRVIGNLSALDAKIQAGIQEAEELTQHNNQLTLVVAINYGGQWDITQAAYRFAEDVVNHKREINKPSVEIFNQY
jgi:undecaprenyl diphosphate synthase